MRPLLPAEAGDLDSVALEDWYAVPTARHVRANFVATLDGAIEIDRHSGGLGGEGDRQVFGVLRALADVVLVGAGTVRAENYGPVYLPAGAPERRVDRGQAPRPPLAVITGSAALDPAGRLFVEAPDGPRPLVLTAASAAADRRQALAAVAEVVICGEDMVETALMLDALAERGLTRVLCEGGPTVLGQLATAGLLGELCLTHSPLLAGPGRHLLSSGHAFDAPVRLEITHLIEDGGMLLARYAVKGD